MNGKRWFEELNTPLSTAIPTEACEDWTFDELSGGPSSYGITPDGFTFLMFWKRYLCGNSLREGQRLRFQISHSCCTRNEVPAISINFEVYRKQNGFWVLRSSSHSLVLRCGFTTPLLYNSSCVITPISLFDLYDQLQSYTLQDGVTVYSGLQPFENWRILQACS